MAPSAVLGPPELYSRTSGVHSAAATSGDAFVDLMVVEFNKFSTRTEPPRGFTENYSATYLSSGNPCLDFFFHIVPDTPPESLAERLALAWSHNPLTTLKLMCNLRGVRGTGKSDKEGFYRAALWLFRNHPRTLACNVGAFADFGYFKDLLEILYRLLEGPDVRRIQKEEWLQRKGGRKRRAMSLMRRRHFAKPGRKKKEESEKSNSSIPREEDCVAKAMARSKQEEEKARDLRREKKIAMARKLIERYNRDSDFRFLYDKISEHFAQSLRKDLEFLHSGEINKIGLAAKWCPSIDSSFDRSILLCESIAKLIFQRESYPEYDGVEEAHYVYRVRDRLRKEVLVPLQKVLELPEVYMGANDWGSIPYNRVASVAMKLYKGKFMKHDKQRFQEYLDMVKSGKAKIAAGALLPHEIIASLNDGEEDVREVAELQWKRMVDDLLKSGKLENCIAVSDVSGSMTGIPMEVSVALGILVSELSKDPWKGKVITFSESPQLHLIKGDDLAAKTQFVRNMDWGGSTNFQKVFDLILEVAKKGKLSSDQIVKRVIVFSDMEFDQASRDPWETDYQVIKRKFREAGYEDAAPQIVFWNLRNSRSTPVSGTQEGVALVSGFSKNLLNLFLDKDGQIDPELVMLEAISGEEYQKLVVMD
ncbi:uncharacterized protein LOC116210728 [Punica granatum]|uniref:Uncharacterized protein LOC116190393 n=2 Tax=Punica granatum TaxID=22663 RepID=A0A6P8C2F1_PUNGR|nr:uncharacterized protein LOC116190393 [Punica granatum]XP_031400609.1 uncharacterized protein LOC116210728 [Punica granatum]OWM76252.1 hypothetical protein CDL15_Pgr009898 [Punica granatum]PKI71406.1 hypothetical protein CRG98_008185 [Punica granatum]